MSENTAAISPIVLQTTYEAIDGESTSLMNWMFVPPPPKYICWIVESRTVIDERLLFKPPRLWYFVMVAKMTKTTFYPGHFWYWEPSLPIGHSSRGEQLPTCYSSRTGFLTFQAGKFLYCSIVVIAMFHFPGNTVPGQPMKDTVYNWPSLGTGHLFR